MRAREFYGKLYKQKPEHRDAQRLWLIAVLLCVVAAACPPMPAQTCRTGSELDDALRSALTTTSQRIFDLASKSDSPSLRQNAIGSLAADFSAVENTIKNRQTELAGAQVAIKSIFLLETTASTEAHAEFYCGIFGKNGQTPSSAVFALDNLPPGTYAIVLLDAASAKARDSFSLILLQAGTDWKLAGLYLKPAQAAGHDSDWFAARAREYKAKGQTHNAWLFFMQARNLASPLSFMSTLATDRLYDEVQSVQPPDVPLDGKTADLTAGTSTYKLTALFLQAVGDDIDVVVKYQAADAADTQQAYKSNVEVIKALVAKYPELRDAFAAVVARAVDTAGRDYGTLLAMKDIK